MATVLTSRRGDEVFARRADEVYNPQMMKCRSLGIMPVSPCCAASPKLDALAVAANTAAALRRADAMSEKWGVVPARRLSARQLHNLALCGHTRRARSGAEQVRRNADEWKRRGW